MKSKTTNTATKPSKGKAAIPPPEAPRLINVQPYDAFDAGTNPWLVLSIVDEALERPMALGVHVQRSGGLRHTRIAVSRLQREYKRLGTVDTAATIRTYQRVLRGPKGTP